MRVIEANGPDATVERAALLERRSAHPIAAAIAAAFAPEGGPDHERESGAGVEPGPGVVTDGGVADREAKPETGEPRDDAIDGTDHAGSAGEREDRVTEFESHGTGVSGTVDGVPVVAGHPDLFAERGWELPARIRTIVEEARANGNVPVVVGEEGTADGVVVVGDDPREGWEDAVSDLAEEGVEIAVLTGDDRKATGAFEDHPAIDHVFAGVPPEAKAETVRRLGSKGRTVMVGDGTNDAPALATADLGIALGSGTALAADAADVAIVTDDLSSLGTTFDLSRAANSRVRQNIGWAFCYNAVAIPLAVTGVLNPLFAALAMGASSLLVVSNSARSLLD
jgi:Cu2+-exporting ATPase